MALAEWISETKAFSDQGGLDMTEIRNARRAAPVVELLIGLRQQARPSKQEHNTPVTVDAFEREHMGLAAKE